MPDSMVDIARKIREVRKNMGLTQAEFAERLGASQGSVSKWEAGRETPRLEALQAIRKLSGLDIGTIGSRREHSHKEPGGLRTLPVVGSVQYKYGVETPFWSEEDHFDLTVPVPYYWGPARLFGMIVKGKTTWPNYPPGTVLILASDTQEGDAEDIGLEQHLDPEDGDLVVCSVRKTEGLRELVLRKIVQYANGDLAYWQIEGSREDRVPPAPCTAWGWDSWAEDAQSDLAYNLVGIVALAIVPIATSERLIQLPDTL